MRTRLILALFLFVLFGCKKENTASTVTVVVSKFLPQNLISISIVNQKGVNILSVVKQGDGTYTTAPVYAGDNLTVTYNNTNDAQDDSTDGDIRFTAAANNISDIGGDIVYKPGGYTFTIPIN